MGDGKVVQVAKSKPTSHNMGKQTMPMKSQLKMADYPPSDCQVIRTAIEFYHALLLTENPFPEPHEELKWARDAFDASHIYNKLLHVELDLGKIKIVNVDLHRWHANHSISFRSLCVVQTYGGNSNWEQCHSFPRHMGSKQGKGQPPRSKTGSW